MLSIFSFAFGKSELFLPQSRQKKKICRIDHRMNRVTIPPSLPEQSSESKIYSRKRWMESKEERSHGQALVGLRAQTVSALDTGQHRR
jgi:predicted metal-dependent hydrolase